MPTVLSLISVTLSFSTYPEAVQLLTLLSDSYFPLSTSLQNLLPSPDLTTFLINSLGKLFQSYPINCHLNILYLPAYLPFYYHRWAVCLYSQQGQFFYLCTRSYILPPVLGKLSQEFSHLCPILWIASSAESCPSWSYSLVYCFIVFGGGGLFSPAYVFLQLPFHYCDLTNHL